MNQQQNGMPHFTHDEAKALVREAVRETFLMLGVKVDDPLEVQKDFQHLREWRYTMQSIRSKGMLTLVGIALTGLLAAAWLGIKDLVSR